MQEVKLHDIGEGMTEGEIVHYLVKVGDTVKVDEPLVEVQTDKMTAELPSPCSGTVKEIIIDVGETIQVGTTILVIETDVSAIKEEPKVKTDSTQPKTSKVPPKIEPVLLNPFKRVLATPYTRKIAREHQIDIEIVPASDPSGRVTEEDVYRFINQGQVDADPVIEKKVLIPKAATPDEIPFKGIRKQIAIKMAKSLYTIPHVTHFDEVNMTNLLKLREDLKAEGESITVVAFFIKALCIALKDFPIFNAELDEENEKILLKKNYNIGIATNSDSGLLVPVVHNADQKSIREIHQHVKDLTEKAIGGKLSLAEMQSGTFTMSNVGPLGSTGATPIINYPETALIAFHKTKKQPIFNEHDEIVVGHIMTLSMSFDHRVADGATAVAFTNRFASLIEKPHLLMMEMI